MAVNIYVMERGFVLVGTPRPAQPGEDPLRIVLEKCAVVRRWGTTQGLGELAVKGPLAGTILDPEPPGVKLGVRAIYREIPCDEEAWRQWVTSR